MAPDALPQLRPPVLSLTLLSARFGRFVDRPQLFVERDLLKTPASRERRLRRHLDSRPKTRHENAIAGQRVAAVLISI